MTAEGAATPRVLVIDDEQLVARLVARSLAGYDVHLEFDSARGLERLLGGERFDLVLCDLMMPEVTGIDIYERVRAANPALAGRIVFLTGGAFTERSRAFLESVPNPHITKPFKPSALRSLCGEQLAR